MQDAPARRGKRPKAERARDDGRFHCPYPGCDRSCAELWRLKVHYRAPADNKGSGVERGHGAELDRCPRCLSKLEPGRHHVGCRSGLAAPRQALKRERSMKKARARQQTRSLDSSSGSGAEEQSDAGHPEAAQSWRADRELGPLLAAEAVRLQLPALEPGFGCGSGASQGSMQALSRASSLPFAGLAACGPAFSGLGCAVQLRRSASAHSDATRFEQLPLAPAVPDAGLCCPEVEEDDEVLIPRSFMRHLGFAPPACLPGPPPHAFAAPPPPPPLLLPPLLPPPVLLSLPACQMRVWRLADGASQPQLLSPQPHARGGPR